MGVYAGTDEVEMTCWGFGSESVTEFGWGIHIHIKPPHFISNAIHAAGRELGKAVHTLQDVEGKVTGALAKIPVVGSPLKSAFDYSFHALTMPVMVAGGIASGKRIDRVVMGEVKTFTRDLKGVAPLAQSIISVVPGVGTGISGALGAGLALAEGQPMDKVAEAAVAGAIPGGQLAVAAFHVASNGVKAAVTGKKFDFVDAAKQGLSAGLQTLGLPAQATQALSAGVDAAGKIAHGEPLDKTLTSEAISVLPVSAQAQSALHEATNLSIDLAHGKPLDKAMLARIHGVAGMLPIDDETKKQIQDAAKEGKSLVEGHPLGATLGVALHSAVASSLITHSTKGAPKPVTDALKVGLATGTAVVHQAHTSSQLKQVTNKLVENGIGVAKAVPAIGEARKLAGAGTKGFDHAMGLLSHSITPFALLHARDQHAGQDKLGFDLAVSVKTGLVTQPIPANLSPAAIAGHAIVHGSSGMPEDNRSAIAATVKAHPSASVGAKVAATNIQAHRDNWIARFFHAIGFR